MSDPEHISEIVHRWLRNSGVLESAPKDVQEAFGYEEQHYLVQFSPAAGISVVIQADSPEHAEGLAQEAIESALPINVELPGGISVFVDRDASHQHTEEYRP